MVLSQMALMNVGRLESKNDSFRGYLNSVALILVYAGFCRIAL